MNGKKIEGIDSPALAELLDVSTSRLSQWRQEQKSQNGKFAPDEPVLPPLRYNGRRAIYTAEDIEIYRAYVAWRWEYGKINKKAIAANIAKKTGVQVLSLYQLAMELGEHVYTLRKWIKKTQSSSNPLPQGELYLNTRYFPTSLLPVFIAYQASINDKRIRRKSLRFKENPGIAVLFDNKGKLKMGQVGELKIKELAKEIALETRYLDMGQDLEWIIAHNTRGTESDIDFLMQLKGKTENEEKELQEEIEHIKKYNITRIDYIEGLLFTDNEIQNKVKKYFKISL